MLWNASAINRYAIAASDGRLGTVCDFLFDDANWLIRWLVVDTGNWLSGRKVLLPPSVLGHLDPKGQKFSVGLTMQQVEDSPEIDTERPVSRQMGPPFTITAAGARIGVPAFIWAATAISPVPWRR